MTEIRVSKKKKNKMIRFDHRIGQQCSAPIIDQFNYSSYLGMNAMIMKSFKRFVRTKISEEAFKVIELDVDKASLRCAERLNDKAYELHYLLQKPFTFAYANNKSYAWMKRNIK